MYECGQEEIDAVAAVIRSKQLFRYRGGENGEVTRLEARLCELTGAEHALAVTSGTAALVCGLVGLGIGPGDEVIVPAYTWLASAGAVLSVGAIPILAEVDETLTLDPEDFERRIGPRTKAVMPVHMAGRPADLDRICEIAKAHDIRVIEDACQGVGGSYKGRRLTSIGDCGAFSFNQFKNIACGEGGAILTDDDRIYQRALIYHDMGCSFRGHAGEVNEPLFLGTNFRLNELLGAFMNVQLDRIDGILDRLRERRNWILDAVRNEAPPFHLSPSADLAGDCGCVASFLFESADARKAVAEQLTEKEAPFGLSSPIDSGLHVYTNWTVFLEQRGGHHPDVDPYRHPANAECRKTITPEDFPRTLELLARTGVISVQLDWSREQCKDAARTLCHVADDVLA